MEEFNSNEEYKEHEKYLFEEYEESPLFEKYWWISLAISVSALIVAVANLLIMTL